MSETTTRTLFVPLLLIVLSLLAMAGFQTWQLVQQQSNLDQLRADQASAVEESQRVRSQLQSIAQGTADLALVGNKNAQFIVDELSKQGITVTGSAGVPSTP